MNFTVIDVPQRSDAWHIARAGLVTSSTAAIVMATGRKKTDESVQRKNLRVQLALERINGRPLDTNGFQTADMKRGAELEPFAIRAYEAATGTIVRRTGFLRHNELAIGASLDGHVGAYVGICEFKCPKWTTHLEYLDCTDKVPAEYAWQVTHQLLVCDVATWCDFCSFDDRWPEGLQLHQLERGTRKDFDLDRYRAELVKFLAEVDDVEARIRKRLSGAPVPSMWQRAAEAVA